MKHLFTLLLAILLTTGAHAQTPQRINYQAILRDAGGAILPNTSSTLGIAILQGSASGAVVYNENHSVTTNGFGLANVAIGGGTIVSGTMAAIDWSAGPYFVRTSVNGTPLGTSQLLSVPYALFAETSNTPGPQGEQGEPGADGAQGVQGIPGAQGATGAQGVPGATGPEGPEGPQGPQGEQGPAGADGTGVSILGTLPDESQLPTTGNPGDAYLIDGSLYVWSPTTNDWSNSGNIQGPQGPQGIQGVQGATGATGPAGATGATGAQGATGLQGTAGTTGAAGADGRTVLNGATNPTGATGANGDFYINTSANTLFGPKTGGAWGTGVPLVGPQGATGATGPQGATGATGSQGNTGATGEQGNPGATGTPGAPGPQGIPGTNGTNGTNGLDGKTVLNGATDPANTLGTNGDFYINTTTNFLFGPKANGLWNVQTAVSLVGPEGPPGPGGAGWALLGNAGTVPANNFIGTTDDQPLQFKVNNIYSGWISGTGSTSFGYQAFGPSNTTIDANTAFGFRALTAATGAGIANAAFGRRTLNAMTTGLSNSAFGDQCMLNTTTGGFNCAIGQGTMGANTTGSNNTALGYRTMNDNTVGFSNVAVGVNALRRNLNRSNLVAIGDSALYNNAAGLAPPAGKITIDYGYYNTAVGSKSQFTSVSGLNNTSLGYRTLYLSTGSDNTAVGAWALDNNTSGSNNTAVGDYTLGSNTSGNGNSGMGYNALSNATGNAEYNAAMGFDALAANTTGRYNSGVGYGTMAFNTTGHNNTAIGRSAGPSVNGLGNAIAIGYDARPTATDMARIGNTALTSINGAVNFSMVSDARYKQNLRSDVEGLDFILALKPMTYTYDVRGMREFLKEGIELDKDGNEIRVMDPDTEKSIATKERIRYSGFLAQDVEKAAQAVGYDFSGVDAPTNDASLYGLRYAEFVVPLVKAVQEQQAIIEQLLLRVKELEASAGK